MMGPNYYILNGIIHAEGEEVQPGRNWEEEWARREDQSTRTIEMLGGIAGDAVVATAAGYVNESTFEEHIKKFSEQVYPLLNEDEAKIFMDAAKQAAESREVHAPAPFRLVRGL